MAKANNEDSKDSWKYTTVLSKFIIDCIEMAISKSFGVLIPVMIVILSTNSRTLGFVCSMPSAWMNLTCPIVAYVLKTGAVKPRVIALAGALLCSVTLISAGYIRSIPGLGICLSITGIGLSMGYLSTKVMLNEYFKKSYVFVAALTNLGGTSGAFLAPFIIEMSLEAYGYGGAMLILAGISLHAIPASATLRKPKDSLPRPLTKGKDDENTGLLAKEAGDRKEEPANLKREASEQSLNPSASTLSAIPAKFFKNILEWVANSILIKEPLFTMTLPLFFFTTACVNAWVLFLVPRAEWHGIPSSRAAFVSTIGGAGGIVGRVLFIALLYFGANPIILSCIFYMLSAVTFLADPLITTFPEMCAVAFIQGCCVFSCHLALSGYLKYSVSDENFTMAAGIDGLISGFGRMSGGFIAGLIKDATQSFTTVFIGIGVVLCVMEVNAVLFLLYHRRRETKQH